MCQVKSKKSFFFFFTFTFTYTVIPVVYRVVFQYSTHIQVYHGIHRCTSCTHEYMRVSTHACRAVHASMADARKRTCAEGSDRNCTITKNVRKVSGHDNNAFEWLESSIADANLPKTARTRFTTAESSIADANLPKTARTRFTTADTRPWS